MAGEGWDWCVGSKMVVTMCFSVMDGTKVGLPVFHFWHQDSVSLDWFGPFTASQSFQCLLISIMNGFARLRFEFIMYNQHHTPAFELRLVTISAPGPYISHQDGVCFDWFRPFPASQPFQCLIESIMNKNLIVTFHSRHTGIVMSDALLSERHRHNHCMSQLRRHGYPTL